MRFRRIRALALAGLCALLPAYGFAALRLAGALGPLQEAGVSGSLTFDLADRDGATEATLTYSVGGYRQGGFQTLAPVVDTVLTTQLRRLAPIGRLLGYKAC